MRLILSRKGFDSTSGGCPSPIFPDGTLLSLPIPDRASRVRYADLAWNGWDVGALVERLTGGAQQARHGAHLDPDLRREARPRPPGWRPALGQRGAAQGHLANRGVGPGDLFLFFGLFREVDAALRFIGRPRHVVWGWLQVGAVAPVDERVRPALREPAWRWAAQHPHLAFPPDASNTLYVAADRLTVPGARPSTSAAGVFAGFDPTRELTAPDARGVSSWSLPACFLPRGRRALSYHGAPDRWSTAGSRALLKAAGRGQEFVLDAAAYPEVVAWAAALLPIHSG